MNEQMITTLRNFFATKQIDKAWIFGSYARREENSDSDIDIMISFEDNKTMGLKFFGMWRELENLLGKNVDLVTEQNLLPFAEKTAQKDKILIYERTNQR
ncbi:MAG: nucleotidyltransferase family protein [Bacteroidales bacterium]|nr:nucleotidyltransferase family protein [Bacteroidales bacterium]